MKKKLIILISLIALLASCGKKTKSFDTALIYGKWQSGQEYWVYDANGTGHTWDEAEDVKESEATSFYWKIDGEALQITIVGQMGQEVPKDYTLTELTSTTLSYKDGYGKSFTFSKCTN